MSSTSAGDPLVRTVLILVAVILLLPLLMMVLMLPLMGMWGGGHMWNGMMWNGTATWMWLLMWLVPLLILLGLGYGLYRAVRDSGGRRADPAIEELRTAYARGDLSDEEFEQRRERLERER